MISLKNRTKKAFKDSIKSQLVLRAKKNIEPEEELSYFYGRKDQPWYKQQAKENLEKTTEKEKQNKQLDAHMKIPKVAEEETDF